MKLNKFLMLGLAGLAFAACSNDDENITDGREDGKVRITLSVGKTESRSQSVSAAGLHNKITDLEVHFYNGSGLYVDYPASGMIGDKPYDNAAVIEAAVDKLNTESTHTWTIELKDIPSSATQIYVVANGKNKSNQVGTSSLTDASKTPIYLRNQVLPQTVGDGNGLTADHVFEKFSGEESRLTGLETSIPASGEVTVQLRPVPSRIEMAKVTAIPVKLEVGETWNGANIKDFKVEGFYINNFYTVGALDPTYNNTITDRNRIDFSNISGNYTQAAYRAPTQVGVSGNWGFMCDEPAEGDFTYAAGDGVNTIYAATPADATMWWGFMTLQGEPVHTVVKLNVTYVDEAGVEVPNQIRYLTITNYTYAKATDDGFGGNHGEGTAVASFLRGHVYRITDIQFDVRNLTETPYEVTKSISATVQVMPWVGVDVKPGFNGETTTPATNN